MNFGVPQMVLDTAALGSRGPSKCACFPLHMGGAQFHFSVPENVVENLGFSFSHWTLPPERTWCRDTYSMT